MLSTAVQATQCNLWLQRLPGQLASLTWTSCNDKCLSGLNHWFHTIANIHSVWMILNDLRSINNSFGLASKVHPMPMSKMERRVQNKKNSSLEVETDTRISAVTFFPTYHHPEKWSLVFFSSCFGWHGDWVTRQPVLKAARYSRLCVALRETACLRMWTNWACVTLDLDRTSMTCEHCGHVRAYVCT